VTRIYCVAGNPILQSKSPPMFKAAFRQLGIEASYIRFAASTAKEVMACAREIGMGGLNITAPFKSEIVQYLDHIEDDAKKLGSVNTIVRKEGLFVGHNTDIAGVLAAVRNSGFNPSKAKVVVLGAGGAARAAVIALNSVGASVVLVNRTYEKAREAAEELNCASMSIDQIGDALEGAGLLVSAVSTTERVIAPSFLKRQLTVLEANYGRPTALAEDASRAGCTVIDGREWLLGQALPAFELFTGRAAPEDLMKKVLWKRRPDGRRNVALIGFMGSGKSVVAQRISSLAGVPAIDIDKKIEEREGLSIPEIFENIGETGFRKLEQMEIDRTRLMSGHVVSCGGGAVLTRANVRVLRNNCLSVWLWVNVKTALVRTAGTAGRPLLSRSDPARAASALLAPRIPLYAGACDFLVSTEEKSPTEIAERIWHEISSAFEN
jgi:shikimate dehydrogenase